MSRFALTRRYSLFSLSLGCTLMAASAQAEIDYHVVVQPDQSKLLIDLTIPAKEGPLSVQIGNWMPGSYSYGNFYQNVHDVAGADSKGNTLTVTHPDNNTWTVDSPGNGPVKLSYWIPTAGQRRFSQTNDRSYIQISGPATYMYVLGRKTESCKISFDVPPNWPVMLSLDEVNGQKNTFSAPTYDVLADAPVSTGDVMIDHYNLRGKDHYIVIEGAAKDKVDRARLLKDCRFVSAAETDFFGGAPYNKYVWHFVTYDAPDGAGGLEHLGSTQITLAAGEGPRAQSVLSHEYFHLWNVKRTRSKPLGPFDYLTLPRTGALWWLEGVTDYYANLLPYRYGEWDKNMFFESLVRNMDQVRRNPARLEVSPYQASYRVADANNGRGNSNGYQISYYNLGWLCGMCLDTEIRAQTNNKHSLDDVTRALFDLCKNNKPGFEEDEIRKQCIRFGGPELGPFYDKVVMTPGELPIEEQLGKMGLKLEESDEPFTEVGFTALGGPGGHGAAVRAIRGPGEGKLQDGDVIMSINGQSLDVDNPRTITTTVQTQLAAAKVGTPIALTVKRGTDTVNVSIDPVTSTRKARKVAEDPEATPQAVSLRNGWLMTKSAAVQ